MTKEYSPRRSVWQTDDVDANLAGPIRGPMVAPVKLALPDPGVEIGLASTTPDATVSHPDGNPIEPFGTL